MADHIDNPLVSIVIVNYNGINFIEPCLKSVLAVDYPNFEIIFVDNASSDGSKQLIKDKFFSSPKLKIIENEKSLGPVKGRNIGIGNSKGEYIAFLDNDTEVDKNWLKALIRVFSADATIGAVQSKILLSDRKTFDTCGHYLSISGFPYEIGVGERDTGQYNNQKIIFGARSAAMAVRKDVLDQTGYFDEDYFMHSEETDLSWRIWLCGFRVAFAADSIVYHKRGGSLSKGSQNILLYEGAKNCAKTLIKNLNFGNLFFILPMHIFIWLALSTLFIMKGRVADGMAIIKGILWNVSNIDKVSADRKKVQGNRKIKDKDLFPVIMGDYSFPTLVKKGLSWIGRIYA